MTEGTIPIPIPAPMIALDQNTVAGQVQQQLYYSLPSQTAAAQGGMYGAVQAPPLHATPLPGYFPSPHDPAAAAAYMQYMQGAGPHQYYIVPNGAYQPYFPVSYYPQGGVPQDMYFQQAMTVPPPAPTTTTSAQRPLQTSTPLPSACPPITSQVPYPTGTRHAYLNYHRPMEQEDVLADLSKISIAEHSVNNTLQEIQMEERDYAEYQRQQQQQRAGRLPMPGSNYKTRLCTVYATGRHCDMGRDCRFAHGAEELRGVDRMSRMTMNPRYKTKMCKNYFPGAGGFCPYGQRCEYIHPTDKEFNSASARAERGEAAGSPERRRQGERDSGFGTSQHLNLRRAKSNMHINRDQDNTPDWSEPPMQTRSAAKNFRRPASPPRHLKNARSLQCLAGGGGGERRPPGEEDSAIGSGSSESAGSARWNKPLGRRVDMPLKFARRRTLSQMNLHRFGSVDRLAE